MKQRNLSDIGHLPAAFTVRQPGSGERKVWISTVQWETSDKSVQPIAFQCEGVWDTGASSSVISENVANTNGLMNRTIGFENMNTANGPAYVPVCLLNVTLIHNTGTMLSTLGPIPLRVAIMNIPTVDALIGMDIIGLGDLCLSFDKKSNESVLTFRYPPTRSFDFVEENEVVLKSMSKIKNWQNGNVQCPCRSGKKVRKCHLHPQNR